MHFLAEKAVIKLGIVGFKVSRGWLTNFKKRHRLKYTRLHREGASSVDKRPDVVEKLEELRQELADYEPQFVFNMDEIVVEDDCKRVTDSVKNRKSSARTKIDKSRVTIIICYNSTGTIKIKAGIFGKSKRLRAFACLVHESKEGEDKQDCVQRLVQHSVQSKNRKSDKKAHSSCCG